MNPFFYYHPIFLDHDTGEHPECADRCIRVLDGLKKKYGKNLTLLEPRRAGLEEVAAAHSVSYLERVKTLCEQGGGALDGDTPVSPLSFEAALYGSGALMDGADALMDKQTDCAFALVRPPGHHAMFGGGMGFCLINHVAVCAHYLLHQYEMDRILILDFDVHHGNGTQDIFYDAPWAYFLSMHRYPFYPGTGGEDQIGQGEGQGFTRNLPIPYGADPDVTVTRFNELIEETALSFQPQMILVSAGFDAYIEDPVGGLGFLPEHFTQIGKKIRDISIQLGHQGVLSTLEGGYSLTGLPLCVCAYIEGLSPS